jgi:hypothetical protein
VPDVRASAERLLSRFLARSGRRVMAFKIARGLGIGVALGLFALLGVALLVGPSVGVIAAALCWSALLLLSLVSTALGIGRIDLLRGPRRALLLAEYDPQLAQRVRSAAELAAAPNGSPELVTELLASITGELSALPMARLVPRPKRWGRMLLGSLAFTCASAALLASREDVASGLYAMTHPSSGASERAPSGLWVSRLDVVVSQPRQLGGEPRVLADPAQIEVPEGSIVELNVRARFAIDRAVLKLGERTLPFVALEGGLQRLTLTAESSGKLALQAHVDDGWVEDPKARSINVIEDAAPNVELQAPASDVAVAADEAVTFNYRAKDDHGLSGIDLVIEVGPGRQRRVRLFGFPEGAPVRAQEGSAEVVPAAFGARSGQTLAVWIEARDRDTFGGANVGRSPVRTITVGELHEGHGVPVELLSRARDAAVDTLAERLESELPSRQGEAQLRVEALAKSTRGFSRALSALAKSYAGGGGESAAEATLRDMLRRLSRLLRDEKAASEGRDMREPRRADEALVRELEDDVLWLSDLLGREKLSNAGKAIERLSATRARMQQLIEELKKAWDPARKAELLAEIARARAELEALSQRLAEAEQDVPGDFVNLEALRAAADQNPLDEIEQAIQRGDLAAAEQALARLDADMQSFQKGVSEGGEAFAAARFGPREQAIEKGRAGLADLTKRQKQLAADTDRVAERAHARGEQEPDFRSQNQRLTKRAEALERRVRKLGDSDRFHNTESEAQAGAAQRMRDARDALRQQNPREAASMAERAAEDLQGLAGELMMDARMFPGPEGAEMERARSALSLAQETGRLAQEIARNAPGDAPELTPEESASLQQKAGPQRGLSESADGLSQDLRSDGPPGLSDGLGRTSRSMKKAASALERGDVREAEAHQRDALERLAELNQQLERQSKASGPRDNRAEGSSGMGDQDERVAIPESGQDARRKELRRRVLDARRAQPPSSFAGAVERYYQEILR